MGQDDPGQFVWRFKLEKAGRAESGGEDEIAGSEDEIVRFARRQIRALLEIVALYEDGKRMIPTAFSIVTRTGEIFPVSAAKRGEPRG